MKSPGQRRTACCWTREQERVRRYPPLLAQTPMSKQREVLFPQLLVCHCADPCTHSVQDLNGLTWFRSFWNHGIWRFHFLVLGDFHRCCLCVIRAGFIRTALDPNFLHLYHFLIAGEPCLG